jgi:hypothetical protein
MLGGGIIVTWSDNLHMVVAGGGASLAGNLATNTAHSASDHPNTLVRCPPRVFPIRNKFSSPQINYTPKVLLFLIMNNSRDKMSYLQKSRI